ncbi:hypothetical protein C1701_26635 [Actinoalloteichus sp. AHMU CJ021]|nr:hypothetical protein C1701_26635 [Actinoalloteichus sp. AHMU CJ021]
MVHRFSPVHHPVRRWRPVSGTVSDVALQDWWTRCRLPRVGGSHPRARQEAGARFRSVTRR